MCFEDLGKMKKKKISFFLACTSLWLQSKWMRNSWLKFIFLKYLVSTFQYDMNFGCS